MPDLRSYRLDIKVVGIADLSLKLSAASRLNGSIQTLKLNSNSRGAFSFYKERNSHNVLAFVAWVREHLLVSLDS